MVITRIASTNFLFRHYTHMNEISLCANRRVGPSLGLEPVRLLSQNRHEDSEATAQTDSCVLHEQEL